MAISREDFSAAYRAVVAGTRTAREVKAAFREQQSLLDRGQRKSMAELLGVPLDPHADIRSHPAALDAVGEVLLELEILNETELEKLIGSYLSRTYRKSLAAVAIPPALSRFDFQWEIGRGRSGAVFRARRAEAPHEVAIRLFRPESRPDSGRARKMTEIEEPGIARTHEVGDDYLVMEFVEGESVDALLAERKLGLRRGFELVEKAARVLAPLHAKGLAHGSISPSALLVTRQEAVKIAEFGLAAGTLADDVFALGAILYEIGAGVPPYEGFHAQELRPPSRFNASVAGSAEKVICKALARDPARRYPDAGALADDIARYLRHEDVSADVTADTAGATASRRRRLPIVVAGIAAVVLVVLAIVFGRSKPAVQPGEPSKIDAPKPMDGTPPEEEARRPEEEPPKPPPKPPVDPRHDEIARKGLIGRDEERDLRYKGNQALSAGDWDRLLAIGDEFIIRGADRDYAYYWLALAYRGKKDEEKALEAIDAALTRSPDNAEYLQVRLPLLLARGEAGRALKDIERIYGEKKGEVNAAIRGLTQEMNSGDTRSILYLTRGALFHYKRNYRQAAADFGLAVQAGESKALYFYGLSLMKDDRPAEAMEALRKFIAACPSLPAAEEARALLAELERK